MLNLIGDGRALDGNTLIVNVLGNYLSKESKGYHPCLEIEFDDSKTSWDWYCKTFKIEVNEEDLHDSKHTGFKKVNFNDCILVEMTEEQAHNEVEKYIEMFKDETSSINKNLKDYSDIELLNEIHKRLCCSKIANDIFKNVKNMS